VGSGSTQLPHKIRGCYRKALHPPDAAGASPSTRFPRSAAWRASARPCGGLAERQRKKSTRRGFCASALASAPAVSGLRGAPVLQAPPQLPQRRRVQLHHPLGHRGRWRRRAGHPPRAPVVPEREQRPSLQRGERRHHRLERQRPQPPARRLFQQGAEPVERARGRGPRGAGVNPNRP